MSQDRTGKRRIGEHLGYILGTCSHDTIAPSSLNPMPALFNHDQSRRDYQASDVTSFPVFRPRILLATP